jgi:hypothetical protein
MLGAGLGDTELESSVNPPTRMSALRGGEIRDSGAALLVAGSDSMGGLFLEAGHRAIQPLAFSI